MLQVLQRSAPKFKRGGPFTLSGNACRSLPGLVRRREEREGPSKVEGRSGKWERGFAALSIFSIFPRFLEMGAPLTQHASIYRLFYIVRISCFAAEVGSVFPQELDDTAARTADPAGDVNSVGCCCSDQARAYVNSRQDKAPNIKTSEDRAYSRLNFCSWFRCCRCSFAWYLLWSTLLW